MCQSIIKIILLFVATLGWGQYVSSQTSTDNDTTSQEVLIFGISPTMGPLKMEQVFGPFARKLDQLMPQSVIFRTRKSREEFNSAFLDGEFDIVIVHPFDFLFSKIESEYVPVIRKKGDLQPVFVTTDKTINSISKLRGKTIAFPTARGFVYEMGQLKLAENEIDENNFTKVIHGDFYSCLQSVANQRADACLSIRNIVRDYANNSNVEFFEIDETYAIPHIVLLLRRTFISQVASLQDGLLELNENEEGRILLRLTLFDEVEKISLDDLDKMKQHPMASQLNRLTSVSPADTISQ